MDDDLRREAALMAAVAERGMALVDVCGSAGVAEACAPMLDAAWVAGLTGQRPDGPDQLRRLEQLAGMDAPDHEAPDRGPEMLAFAGLEALYAALWIAFREEPYDSPSSDVGPDVWSSLDGTVRFTLDPRPVIIDPRNAPSPDPFEAREEEACARDTEVAASLSPAQAAASLRLSASAERATLRQDVRSALREVRAFGVTW